MRFISSLTICLVLCFDLVAQAGSSSEFIRKKALIDLNCIQNMFEVKYAPREWKRSYANWDLDEAIVEARNKISNLSNPTVKECQIILRDFFNSTRDYHVGVRFFSTESATLPFLIKGAQGRYFVCYVDPEQSYMMNFPFKEGDEIISFDGRPIHDVIVELKEREYGNNTEETDQALAELTLTQRRGSAGHFIPSGPVEIVGLKKGAVKATAVTLSWYYSPEKIRDFSKMILSHKSEINEDEKPIDFGHLNQHPFMQKMMIYHLWDQSGVGLKSETNRHDLGSRSSYIPPLGRKIWRSPTDSLFDAYIFESYSGKKIGYIRIPHYIGDEEEVEEFGLTMNLFQRRTDALIIDQINNPGGSVFYLYGLATTLTNRPLCTPKHRIAMTQEEVYMAYHLLTHLDQVVDDETAQKVFGATVGGYPVDFQFVKLMRKFCHFMVNQWNCGKLISDPTYLFGVDEIIPHPKYRYTKPILFLVNALDFSGGDFLPATLQDNERVKVMGVRTAGAGGYVLATSYPNHLGIKGFLMTGSIAERKNLKPIENLGVVPDIKYELSVADLQDNYCEYAAAIVQEAEALIH